MSNQSVAWFLRLRFALPYINGFQHHFSHPNPDAVAAKSLRKSAWLRRTVFLAAVVLLIGALWGQAQAVRLLRTWSPQAPAASPSARYIHAITYDALRSQTVLFGGFGGGGYLSDTWTWDGTTWTQQNPAASPSARAAHAMVYYAAHGNTVLFGGLSSAGTRLGDTWLWNGKAWTQAFPANNPEPRDAAVTVYDAAHGQVVMFGGTNGFALGD